MQHSGVMRRGRADAYPPSFRDGALAPDPESRDSPMCNCTSEFTLRVPRNDDAEKQEDWADRIVAARNRRPFTSLEEFARDTGLPKRALILLADADAFRSIGLDRREALWQVRRLPDDEPLPLFEIATAREQPDENAKPLPLIPAIAAIPAAAPVPLCTAFGMIICSPGVKPVISASL